LSLLEARDVSKRFGPVVALRSASLSVEAGEVHALLGANGAGKSTLVKVLTGVVRPDDGTVMVGGREVHVASPAAATRIGLASVFQDPALVPDLTVAQNLRLTGVSRDAVRRRLVELDLDIDFSEQVADVPLPMLRMLDLARALARDPQLLLLDEITAALPSDLADRVFAVMRDWRERGRSVLFITHRLAEVIASCDRATVLRDGHQVGTLEPQEGGERRIVEFMLGPEAAKAEARAAELEEEGAWSSARERDAMAIERLADRVARAFLLERELFEHGWDRVFDGEVSGLIGSGAFVRFGDGHEGLLPVRRLRGDWWELNEAGTILVGERSGNAIRLGDPVRVRVERVETARGRVDLVPPDDESRRAN
jgi:ABC-type sugar transport system ATPase subunit